MIMSHIPATEAADKFPMGNVFWQLRRLVLFDPSVTHPLPGSGEPVPNRNLCLATEAAHEFSNGK